MSNINSVALSGNLIADCDKGKAGDTPIITFVVASNEYRKNSKTGESEEYPNFIECTMFGERAQGIAKHMTKGQKVTVLGSLRQSRWEKDGEKRSKVLIKVDEVEIFLPKRESDDLKLNSVALSGNLIADCDKGKAGDTPIITFVVASNEYRKNSKTGESEEYPNFIECTMFGKRAQGIAKYMTKGQKVTVLGSLRQSRWEKDGEKRSKVSIKVDEVEIFLPKRESDDLKHAQEDIPW